MKFKLPFALLAMLAPDPSFGSVIISDTFSTDGALLSNGWTVVGTAGTLPLTASGGAVTLTNVASGTSGEDARKPLDTGYTTGVLYYSMLVTPTAATTSASGEYFFAAYSSATSGGGYIGRIFQSTTTGGITYGLSNGGAAPTDWTSTVTLNTEYLVVMRLDVVARTATMGVFDPSAPPVSDSELTISGGTASTSTASVDSLAIRQAGSSAFSNSLSGVMVGTTIADVIPEPSAALLGALGVLGILRRRR